MSLLWGIALFAAGLVVGSFLNVITIRYQPRAPLFDTAVWGGRSRCPYCKKTLTWFELLPLVSFVLQRGKCRSCAHALSVQYPLVEFVTAIIFVAIPTKLTSAFLIPPALFEAFAAPFFIYATTVLWFLVAAILIAMVVIDFRHYLIPDELTIALATVGFLLVLVYVFSTLTPLFKYSFVSHYALLFGITDNVLLARVVGACVGALVFYLIYALSRGKGIGFGDVKLAAALGLLMGWPDIAIVCGLAFIVGGVVGIVLMALGKKTGKDRLPFAPFLVMSVFAVFFFGVEIVRGYFALFGA